jgi:hypothetical protein
MGTYQSKFTGEEIDGLLEEVRNGGGGSSSGTKKVTLWEGELRTEGNIITLNDSVKNYDFIVAESCISSSAGIGGTELKWIDTNTILYSGTATDGRYAYNTYTTTGSGVYYRTLFNFPTDTTIKLIKATIGGTAWSDARVVRVTGIKY